MEELIGNVCNDDGPGKFLRKLLAETIIFLEKALQDVDDASIWPAECKALKITEPTTGTEYWIK